MENQLLQPGGDVQPEVPVHRIPMVGNGPIRDYRAIHRGPGLARQLRHGNQPMYCVPVTTCMLIMSVIFTGTIILVLIVLLAGDFSDQIDMELTPRTTDIPKYI